MSFMDAVKTCFAEKYCDFSGRARRSEYWYLALFIFLAQAVVGGIVGATGVKSLSAILSLVIFLPSLGCSVRRLHDIGKSGWWWLLAFIPVVGGIILLIWTFKDSEPGSNIYGPSPKYKY